MRDRKESSFSYVTRAEQLRKKSLSIRAIKFKCDYLQLAIYLFLGQLEKRIRDSAIVFAFVSS